MARSDVNVSLVLVWPNHRFHRRAREWFVSCAAVGWGICAVTQLGFLRLSSDPSFTAHAKPPSNALSIFRNLTAHADHGNLEVRAPAELRPLQEVAEDLLGHRQVADAHCLALAHAQGRSLATFDQKLKRSEASRTKVEALQGADLASRKPRSKAR